LTILFISDIHGIKTYLDLIEKRFLELHCDYLVVLGDLFYQSFCGNDDYDPEYVQKFLNRFSSSIVCMKGNCDFNRDMNELHFPVYSHLHHLQVDDFLMYLSHGDFYDKGNLPPISDLFIFIYGHEHIPFIEKKNGVFCFNPGSISLPRGGFLPSYMVYHDCTFTIYDINGNVIDWVRV